MTEKTPLPERLVDDESRRSFMKKGAVATVGAGAAVSGAASAQEGGDGGGLTDSWKGLIFANNFQPNARFTFVSGVIEWTPTYGDIQDSWFSDYNTRMIRWQNTGETVQLFVAQDANVGEYDEELGFVTDADDDSNQPQLFQMNQEWTPFGDNEQLITVNVSPVSEEEEDAILEDEDWWQDGGANGGTETGTPGAGNSNETTGGS